MVTADLSHTTTLKVRPKGYDTFIAALHGMQTRSSDDNSVCPSVKRVICDKTKGSCARVPIPHERLFTLVL